MNTSIQNVFHHNLSHCRSPVICGGKPQRATMIGARTEQLCECRKTKIRNPTRSTSPIQSEGDNNSAESTRIPEISSWEGYRCAAWPSNGDWPRGPRFSQLLRVQSSQRIVPKVSFVIAKMSLYRRDSCVLCIEGTLVLPHAPLKSSGFDPVLSEAAG